MRIYKVELEHYCFKAFCPCRPTVLMGSTTCIQCSCNEGLIHKKGTYKDFVVGGELFTEGDIPPHKLAFVYLKCSHR